MSQNQKNQKENNSGLEKYAKYSGIAFQMIIIILLFVWAGVKLDEKYMNDGKLFTVILSLLGVLIGLYVVLKDFIKFKK